MLSQTVWSSLFSALALTFVSLSIEAHRWKTLYSTIFSPTSKQLDEKEVVAKIDHLRNKLTTMQTNTMRMYNVPAEQIQEVEFWVDIDDLDDAKCRPEFDELLGERLEKQCKAASKTMSRRDIPNLAVYERYVRNKQFQHCLSRFGPRLDWVVANLDSDRIKLMNYLVMDIESFDTEDTSLGTRIATNIARLLSNYYNSDICVTNDSDEDELDDLGKVGVFETCREVLSPCYKTKLARFAAYINREEYQAFLTDRVQKWLKYMDFCKIVDQKVIDYATHKLPGYVCRRAKRGDFDSDVRGILQRLMRASG